MQLMCCSSVFQLYTAIAIKKSFLQNETVDLLLTDSTPLFAELKDNAELKSIFRKIIFMPVNQKTLGFNRIVRSHYYRMIFEIFPKHYLNKIAKQKFENYTDIYFSSFNTAVLRLQDYLQRKNKNLKTHLFEDGISTYLIRSEYKWSVPSFIQKLFKPNDFSKRFCDVFLFEPKLMCFDYGFEMVKIPAPKQINGFISSLDKVFDNSKNSLKDKFVFFEESFNNDGLVTNDAELIDFLYNKLEHKDFILKHHPRNRADRFTNLLPTVDFPMFWEHYLLKQDIEKHVLVTVSSNTVFVPYILDNDLRPTVIMLYKIFNGTSPILGSGNFEKYVEQYLKYTKANIYIPKSMEEFEELIKKFKEN